jgi:hypothetical protein
MKVYIIVCSEIGYDGRATNVAAFASKDVAEKYLCDIEAKQLANRKHRVMLADTLAKVKSEWDPMEVFRRKYPNAVHNWFEFTKHFSSDEQAAMYNILFAKQRELLTPLENSYPYPDIECTDDYWIQEMELS